MKVGNSNKRYRLFRIHILSTLFCILFNPQVLAAEPQLLLAAQSMINAGKPLDAFDLLSPYEFEYAGEKEYDYLLGLSLIDIGEPGRAVFAFQRVLAVDPNFAGARMELARAYFDMSEYNMSRAEYITLQTLSPPANVRLVIEKYLAAIRSRTLRSKRGWSGYVQIGVGDDSNANNATTADSFLGFSLSAQSQETKSSVMSTTGSISYDLPVSYRRTYYFRSSLNHRANNDASFTSSFSYDISSGVMQSRKNGDSFILSIQLYSTDVDGSSNNQGYNLNGHYNFNFSASNQIGAFVRLGDIDYVETFDVKDVSQIVTGVSWVHIFSTKLRPSLVSTFIAGQEDQQLQTSPYGRNYHGVRVTAAMALSHQLNLFGSIGNTSSNYADQFFGIPGERKDDFTDFSLGASWRFNKTWTLKALINLVDNASNIDIYSYDKTELMLIARSDFLP